MSIKYKLLLLFLFVTSLPVVIVTFTNFINTRDVIEKITLDSLHTLAQFKEGEIFFFLEGMKMRTNDFSSDGFVRDKVEQSQSKEQSKKESDELNVHLVTNKQPLDDRLLLIDITDIKGNVIFSTDESRVGLDRSGDPYFLYPRLDVYMDDIFIQKNGQEVMEFYAPLITRTFPEKVVGSFINRFDVSLLNSLMTGDLIMDMGGKTNARGMGETGETYLVNEEKLILNDSLFIDDAIFKLKVDTYPVRQCLENDKDVEGEWPDYRGVLVVGASKCLSVADFKWVLVSEKSQKEAFSIIDEIAGFLFVLILAVFFILAFISMYISSSITAPIRKLLEGTKSISNGILDCEVGTDKKDEIGELSRSFDEMAVALKISRMDLEKTNNSLVMKNKELDEFAYIASHDLQEPIRKVISFSDLLVMDLGDDLPDIAKKDLEFITDASKRMQQLIQDLLQLSRTGRSEMHVKKFPLKEAVTQALFALDLKIQETATEIVIGDLPEIYGDKVLITQLYQNLISNAIKFNDIDKPIITLTVENDDGIYIFGVKDNGIGIEPQFTKQIFAPFKKLHGREEYEGSGIGLAICYKAVERHGGKIWVESEAAKGAHFRFTLWSASE